MKRIISYKYLLLILLSLAFFACEKVIDFPLGSTYTRLVVEGQISTDMKRHTVYLTTTTNYYTDAPMPKVKGAVVTINDGITTFNLKETSPGVYQTDSMAGVVGRFYTLNISNVILNGQAQTFTAKAYLKQSPKLDSIAFDTITRREKLRTSIFMYAQEPATVGDYYLWTYSKNRIPQTDTATKIQTTDDGMVNGNYIKDFEVYSADNIKKGDTIELQQISISKEYYDFLLALLLETTYNSGPFSGPPANIKGNISNGGWGMFIAVDIKRCARPVTYRKILKDGF